MLTPALRAMIVDTPGGRIHMQRDPTDPRPGPHGQDPTASAAPNAPGKRDGRGSWRLAILAAHKRNAHKRNAHITERGNRTPES